MLINFYKDKVYEGTVNFDNFLAINGDSGKLSFFTNTNRGGYKDMGSPAKSKSLAEEISIYAALGEKLICVNISDEYELGYKIIPLSDFSFAEDRE